MLGLMRYEGAPRFPVTFSRGSHGVPQIAPKGTPAITWREANPAFADLDVDTDRSSEIGNNPEIKNFRAIISHLAETEGFEPSIRFPV